MMTFVVDEMEHFVGFDFYFVFEFDTLLVFLIAGKHLLLRLGRSRHYNSKRYSKYNPLPTTATAAAINLLSSFENA